MAETENETKPQNDEIGGANRFNILVVLACVLSAGSLIWTTYSLLDFFQVGGIDLTHLTLKELNPVGLSAAATADVAWSLTMVADYRGVRLLAPTRKNEKGERGKFNILPWIGWAEVLFVTFLLVKHGQSMGTGAAAFAGVLPVLTKLSWMMALADLKDPTAPTPEELEVVAERLRLSNVKKAEIKATEKEHEAELEAKRRASEALLEAKRADAEMVKLEKQNEFELKRMELTEENELKAMQHRLRAQLQMDLLRDRQQVQEMQDEFDWGMTIRRRPQTIVGHAVPQALRQTAALGITDGMQDGQDLTSDALGLTSLGLKESEVRQAEMALHYYTVDAQLSGGLTKTAFCKENKINPPRLSEATTAFPPEWFMEHGLATWVTTQA